MLTRHAARELSLQTLFNLDSRYLLSKVDENTRKEVYQNILSSLYTDSDSDEFSKNIISGIFENLKAIDDIITKATPDWGIEKTAIIDRNILRIAIYEMLFSDIDVPPRVVINEAIELAKTFGHKKSFKFISGVLGAIYEATGLKEKDIKNSDKNKKVVLKEKVGAMPYYIKDGEPMFLMVHNIFNKWTLPKGTKEEGKTLEDILKEKINAEGKTGEKIGENKYRASSNKKEVTQKSISYFVFEVSNPDNLKVNENIKGLNNLKWFNLLDFKMVEKYDDMSDIIEKGISTIVNLAKNND